jgi:signal transduction histidine kinase
MGTTLATSARTPSNVVYMNVPPISTTGLAALLHVLVVSTISCSTPTKTPPIAVDGVLDARGWDFDQDESLALEGTWHLVWGHFLDPKIGAGDPAPAPSYDAVLPSPWNGAEIDNKKLGSTGHGTYRLRVLLSPDFDRNLAFKFRSVGTAFRFFVNGEEITAAGEVGTSNLTSLPEWRPHVAVFRPTDAHLDIVVWVSNFHHRKGGLSELIYLGGIHHILSDRTKKVGLEMLVVGAIFLMGLYHLCIYGLQRRRKGALYFGGFCVLIALYSVLSGERFITIVAPGLSWFLRVSATNFTSFMATVLFMSYLRAVFPAECNRKVVRGLQVPILLLAVSTLVLPSILFTQLVPVFHLLALLCAVYCIYVMVRATQARRTGSKAFVFGLMFLIAGLINDILYDNDLIQSTQLLSVGLLLFMLAQSYILAQRFVGAFADLESEIKQRVCAETALRRMKEDLEDQVVARTLLLKERTESLAHANKNLSRTSKVKDQFLATMSHELRTPLNSILGTAEALLTAVYGPLSERQRNALERLEKSGNHLLTLINELLDISRISAGKTKLNLEPVNLELTCLAVIDAMTPQTETAKLKVEFSRHVVDSFAYADKRRVHQIFLNLLGNAIKFTGSEGRIGMDIVDERPHFVSVVVWDTGIGISEDMFSLLFEPFVQAESGLNRRHEGSGLGLALAAELTNLHGGEITLESEVDRGSRFTVHLPKHIPDSAETKP